MLRQDSLSSSFARLSDLRLYGMLPNVSLFAAVDALGSCDEDSHCLCEKMQSVSRFLKSDRYESHPERFIGAGNNIRGSCPPDNKSTQLFPRICANLPALASAASHRHQSSFFNFFFLSLLLDILKAHNSKEESPVTDVDCGENNILKSIDYLSVSLLVINILTEKVVSSNSDWLNSRSCCLKARNKVFVFSGLAIVICMFKSVPFHKFPHASFIAFFHSSHNLHSSVLVSICF